MEAAIAGELDVLGAKLAIGELEARYGWAIDEGRVEALVDIFAPDAPRYWPRRYASGAGLSE